MKKILFCAIALSSGLALAAAPSKKAAEVSHDHAAHSKTADSQMAGSDSDVKLTKSIRSRLTDMDGLSLRAQNITIVTQGDEVTLKGEVDKKEEIQKVMDIARAEARGKNVINKLSVHQ